MTGNVLGKWEDEPYPIEPSRPVDETTSRDAEDDIFDDVTDDVGGIIISGVRPGASFPKKPTADEPEAGRAHSFRCSRASKSAMRASRSASWSSSHATSCSAPGSCDR